MATLDLSLFPDGPAGIYRMGHSILAREGVLFLDAASPAGESQRQIPSTLLPSPLSRPHYESVLAMQPLLNTLYRRVSRDLPFLRETLKTVLSDKFTERLWEICEETQTARSSRPSVGVLRSDYMLHCRGAECGMKQVEVNTVCVGLAPISQRIERAHKHISAVFKKTPAPPLNEAGDRLAEVLALARVEYMRTVPEAKAPVVLFVQEDTDPSFYDHYYILAKLQSDLHVPSAIRSLDGLDRDMRVEGGRVFVGEFEVSVCYYRQGYKPENYSQRGWRVRALLEGSKALQIPDVALQLCGTKSMQQRLTEPGVLDMFLWDTSEEDRKRLRGLFADQFSIPLSPDGDRMAAEAVQHPDLWVLKPQREGGGNNYFGQEMVRKLRSLEGKEERGAYVLMERLAPPSTPNYLISPRTNTDRLELSATVQEVGVFGFYIASGDDVSYDVSRGYLVRSKSAHMEDGGVTAGRAYMDSLDLVD